MLGEALLGRKDLNIAEKSVARDTGERVPDSGEVSYRVASHDGGLPCGEVGVQVDSPGVVAGFIMAHGSLTVVDACAKRESGSACEWGWLESHLLSDLVSGAASGHLSSEIAGGASFESTTMVKTRQKMVN